MEIVKRLEGSEPEEQDFNFEETEKKDVGEIKRNELKKPVLLPLLGLIVLIILSYFGFKAFNTKTTTFDNTLVVTEVPKNVTNENTQKETLTEAVESITKVQEVPPSVQTPQATKHLALYTEELAQQITPPKKVIKEEVEKEKILTPKTEQTINNKAVITKKETKKGEALPQQVSIVKKELPKVIEKKETEKKKVIVQKPKVVKTKQRVITIKKGDTLASIAHHYYGNAMEFKGIIRANRDIKNSKSSLKVGKKLIVPYLAKHKRRRFITVKSGYSLAYISKKFYGTTGKVQEIVDANSDIKNKKSTLRIGQKVYVPRLK